MAVYTLHDGGTRLILSKQGSTFTANSSGFIIRKRRKPLLKRTEKASQQRVNFRHVVSSYRLMSPGEKSAWKSKTPQFTRVNSLGNSYELLGNQLFQGLNQNRVAAGVAINEVAPDAAVFPTRSIISDGFDIDPLSLSFDLDVNSVPSDFEFIFWASEISNTIASLSFPNNYKLIRSFTSGAYTDFDIEPEYVIRYGPGPVIIPGDRRHWYVQIILSAIYLPSGEKSTLASYTALIIQ